MHVADEDGRAMSPLYKNSLVARFRGDRRNAWSESSVKPGEIFFFSDPGGLRASGLQETGCRPIDNVILSAAKDLRAAGEALRSTGGPCQCQQILRFASG